MTASLVSCQLIFDHDPGDDEAPPASLGVVLGLVDEFDQLGQAEAIAVGIFDHSVDVAAVFPVFKALGFGCLGNAVGGDADEQRLIVLLGLQVVKLAEQLFSGNLQRGGCSGCGVHGEWQGLCCQDEYCGCDDADQQFARLHDASFNPLGWYRPVAGLRLKSDFLQSNNSESYNNSTIMSSQAILKKLENKQIAMLGLGVENLALIKYFFKKRLRASLTICDSRSFEQLGERYEEIKRLADASRTLSLVWKLGAGFNEDLVGFDVLFRSPGWTLDCPGIKAAVKKKGKRLELSSPIELFLKLSPTKNIIGVTGTKGKGTTSSLIQAILKQAGKRAWLGGNIGIAPFDFIVKLKKTDWVVLELSSFQLQDIKLSPHLAVMTNFTREHLAPADPNNPNYHKSLKEYWEAKANIFKWQKRGDKLVANPKLESRLKRQKPKCKIIYFGKSDLPSKLIGEHNKENIAAAVEVAKLLNLKKEAVAKAVVKFGGLEHRIEFVREVGGVKYYNDSFATTPEATITALKSFDRPIVLLAGGAEKKSDFKMLARKIKKHVKFVVLLAGDSSWRLGDELVKAGFSEKQIKLVRNIKSAVATAAAAAAGEGIVLLSTACASFGMFKNYKERGNLFKAEVGKL